MSEVVSGPAFRPTGRLDDDGDAQMPAATRAAATPLPEGDDFPDEVGDSASDASSMAHVGRKLSAAGAQEPRSSPFVMPITEDNYMDVAARMVDLKGVAKPPAFTGREADWSAWRFRFESAMALLDLDGVMKAAASHPHPITIGEMTGIAVARSKLLYNILIQVCQGRALAILRLVDTGGDSKDGDAW
jgi:hypothetical protein